MFLQAFFYTFCINFFYPYHQNLIETFILCTQDNTICTDAISVPHETTFPTGSWSR